MAVKRMPGKKASMVTGVALGVAVCMLISVLGACLLAWMVSDEMIAESSIGYGTVLTLLVSSALGTLLAIRKVKAGRLLICVLVSIGYILILLACTALFYGGQYDGVAATALAVLGGSFAVGLLEMRTKKTKMHRRIKIKNR